MKKRIPSSRPPINTLSLPIDIRAWSGRLGARAAGIIRTAGLKPKRPAKGPIQVLDLFCGAGGLSVGFEMVGRLTPSFELAAAVDYDPHSGATYARNLPIRPLIADLAYETSTAHRRARFLQSLPIVGKRPLVLIGGPPCQGFSAHRKKNGGSGDLRNQLIQAFADVAVNLLPDFILLENVPEILSKQHWHLYSGLRSQLERAGYVVRAAIHNLAGFGVPQERFRALVLASRKPFRMPQPFLATEDYLTVRSAIEGLPSISPGEYLVDDPMHMCSSHRRETVETIRQIPKNGGSRPKGVGPRCLQNVDGFRDVYGRLHWDRPANTITAFARNPASGRFVHPEQHRGLSIREAALLQAFPKDFVFEGPFDHKFLQIGNAVPPAFSAFLAAHVLGEMLADSAPDADCAADIQSPTSNSFSSGIAGRKKRWVS
jgi:DNA (cytosine-5)-methyltransferase 1